MGIPMVHDRIAQDAVFEGFLAPIFEPQSSRKLVRVHPRENCHQAIERVLELHRQGYQVVLDADIKGFFDNPSHRCDHGSRGGRGGRRQHPDTLVERFLTLGVMEDGVFKPPTIGTPQGGVITPPTMLQNRP